MTPFERKILQAARIAELEEACGVTPRPQRPLTPEEQKIVDWFGAKLQAAYDEELAKLRAEHAKLRAEMQAERATLSTALPRPGAIPERR